VGQYKINDIIGGQYKVLKIYGGEGESGRGVVYVVDEDHNIIALKSLQEKFLSSEAMVHAFKREALAWVHLERHPYIVRAQYVININEQPFIAMDYIAPDLEGKNTLTHYMEHPITLKRAMKWSIQFCYGMEYAESKGIAPHRDVKPDNIMISVESIVKICDYGLAMFLGEESTVGDWKEEAEKGKLGHSFLRVSKGETVGGTVPWMPGEQFEGRADIRSDIYSYGIVMYQMVNEGNLPFYYGTIDDYYVAHCSEPVPPLNSKLFPIIRKCMEKQPSNRYQTFREMRADLEKLYQAEFGKAPPTPPKEKEFEAWEHNNKGVSFAALDFIEDAISEFKKSLELSPGYGDAHNNLGYILNKQGHIEEAIEHYKQALVSKPQSVEFRNNLAKSLAEIGKHKDASEIYREIVRFNPNMILGHYNLARSLENIGELEDALSYYNNFVLFASKKHSKHGNKIKIAKKRIKELKKKVKN